jgi:DNA-binding transcriptional LysR family regulator
MVFDFRLQVFNTVARRLNFTKAAAELYITQPAVTKHIHERFACEAHAGR